MSFPELLSGRLLRSIRGRDNLVLLLNDNIPTDARIVAVEVESSDERMLRTTAGLEPKVEFLAAGRVRVRLRRIEWFERESWIEDLDTEITIEVDELEPRVDVVEFLTRADGVVGGMHHDKSYEDPAHCDILHRRVAREFGRYPGLYSADFLTGATVPARDNMIDEVIRQWRMGNLVQIMFHVSPPQYRVDQEVQGGWGTDAADETLPGPNRVYSYLSEHRWEELMDDASELARNWRARVDEYARHLLRLQEAGVTVMLRPFHEMNQHVFWWGGRPGPLGTAELFRRFRRRLEQRWGLRSIVWVWNVQDLPDDYGHAGGDDKFARYDGITGGLDEYDADDWASFSPGRENYDVLSVDFYDEEGFSPRRYAQATRIADVDDVPLIIGETFVLPTAAERAAQPRWALAMPWGARTWKYNSTEAFAEFAANTRSIAELPRFATRA